MTAKAAPTPPNVAPKMTPIDEDGVPPIRAGGLGIDVDAAACGPDVEDTRFTLVTTGPCPVILMGVSWGIGAWVVKDSVVAPLKSIPVTVSIAVIVSAGVSAPTNVAVVCNGEVVTIGMRGPRGEGLSGAAGVPVGAPLTRWKPTSRRMNVLSEMSII
jgi:hypothetical protein